MATSKEKAASYSSYFSCTLLLLKGHRYGLLNLHDFAPVLKTKHARGLILNGLCTTARDIFTAKNNNILSPVDATKKKFLSLVLLSRTTLHIRQRMPFAPNFGKMQNVFSTEKA